MSATLDSHPPPKNPRPIIAPSSVRRILVCQLRQIGDVLLATPSIELLAKRYPEAQLHVLTEQKCRPMLENNPHIHTLWTVDKNRLPTLLHELFFYWQITRQRFDIIVDFQQLPRCRWVVVMSRARVKLSYPPPWYTRRLYTHWIQSKPSYAAAYKAGVLEPLGIVWQGERPRLYLTDEERAVARSFLASCKLLAKRFISVDATHRHATRRWPARHFAALMDKLAETDQSLFFFLPYGPGEEKDIRALQSLCRYKDRIVIPRRMLNLRQLAACQEHAVMQLGNCSSPRHMAVALDVPTATILGATGTGWTFPSSEHTGIQAKEFLPMPCQHCNKNSCSKGIPCLELLTPELVFPRVLRHLRTFGKEPLASQSYLGKH